MEPGEPPLDEDGAYPAHPHNEYGWEKLYSERVAMAYGRSHGMAVRIARFQNCYGPEGTWQGGREKAPAAICRKVAEAEDGGTIEIWGDGSAIRSYTYVDDMVDGIYSLMHSELEGPVNIGSPEYHSVKDLVDVVADVAGKRIRVKPIEGPVGVQSRNFSNDRIYATGWTARFGLRDGIERTYPWIRASGRGTARVESDLRPVPRAHPQSPSVDAGFDQPGSLKDYAFVRRWEFVTIGSRRQRSSGKARSVLVLGVTGLLTLAMETSARQASQPPLIGFTAFPYDLTEEAVERVHDIIVPNSNLYAIHLDQCLPWKEALSDSDFPAWLERDWSEIVPRIPRGHAVYVAFTPTATDRLSLVSQCGDREDEEEDLPREIRGAKFNDREVKKAYLNYARRVVKTFNPAYINIGIELGEMARDRDLWAEYEELFDEVRTQLKREHPGLQVGAEFILQWLLDAKIAATVKPLVERSDYIGISFYPYGSEFGEKFGAPALPRGSDQWKNPLEWLADYTDKPVGICETGYTSKNVRLREADIDFPGNETLQAEFLRDLGEIARRERYAFLIWFISVDYEKLVANYPGAEEWFNIWVNAGLFDSDLRPKPAWSEWLKLASSVGLSPVARPLQDGGAERDTEAPESDEASGHSQRLGFDRKDELFEPSKGGRVSLDDGPRDGSKAMRWEVDYDDDWALVFKKLQENEIAEAETVSFYVRSDKDEMILFRVDEEGGEAFYELVPVTTKWEQVKIDLDLLTVDPSSRKNGKLDLGRVETITFGDGSGADGVHGKRKIWIASLAFDRSR